LSQIQLTPIVNRNHLNMGKFASIIFAFVPFLLFIYSCGSANTKADETEKQTANKQSALTLFSVIKLPNVKGGFDLMAVDTHKRRLFVSAEDNHTVEILDVKNNLPLRSIANMDEPKWIVYRPELKSIFVATGGDGKVTEFDDSSFTKRKVYSFRENCNNLRFDTSANQLIVGVGNSFGALGFIDVKKKKIVKEVPLSDYPKQFDVDGNLIYVNIPRKNLIDVVDQSKNKIITHWTIDESTNNVPMALDHVHQRLFVGCTPGKLIIYDTQNGKAVTTVSIDKDADGIYYDAKRSRIYISCGEGYLDVVQQKDEDTYSLLDKVATANGAGTSLFSPALDQLFLAVPQAGNHSAEIRIYKMNNE
jgi:DNA-binding beta-propeller fold protein YncE